MKLAAFSLGLLAIVSVSHALPADDRLKVVSKAGGGGGGGVTFTGGGSGGGGGGGSMVDEPYLGDESFANGLNRRHCATVSIPARVMVQFCGCDDPLCPPCRCQGDAK